MKIYISGKISGIEDIAYNNFEKAEKEISQMDDNIFFNIQIINPMKLPLSLIHISEPTRPY